MEVKEVYKTKTLKVIKEKWMLISFFVTTVIAIFFAFHDILNKYEEILNKLNTTQQMALKSVIWNEEIPLAERSSACDVYLSAGYNSLTKRKCEMIVNKDTLIASFNMEEI